MTDIPIGLLPANHRKHPLHVAARDWPQTNCHTDLWIELLAALGREPRAILGMTLLIDFEGDQFTFFKARPDVVERLTGVSVEELTVYRPLADHVETLLAHGRMPLVEVNAHYLPDTDGLSYHIGHAKTTIGIDHFDRDRRLLRYFHNAGFYQAEAEDTTALLDLEGLAILPPYAEYARINGPGLTGGALARAALGALQTHFECAPRENPLTRYLDALDGDLARLAEAGEAAFHAYAFAVFRQFGAAMELLATHLSWLDETGVANFDRAAPIARELSSGAKALQFAAARAVLRRRGEGVRTTVAAMAEQRAALFEAVSSGLTTRPMRVLRTVGT